MALRNRTLLDDLSSFFTIIGINDSVSFGGNFSFLLRDKDKVCHNLDDFQQRMDPRR